MKRQIATGSSNALAGWSRIPVPEVEALRRPVHLRAQALAARQAFPVHAHPWNQFVYATSGSLVAMLDEVWHVITPDQALWLPTGIRHTTGALSDAAFRNLYIADAPNLRMPAHCAVFAMSPLLRALIVELDAIAPHQEDNGYIDRLGVLIIDQMHRLKRHDVGLPWPRSALLCRLCEALYADPGDDRSMETWGRDLAISPRTLARRFEAELGLTIRDWRRRLRLFRALEWLGAGRGVTEIALDLGYASPSAFTFMFRREMGCSPTDWRGRR